MFILSNWMKSMTAFALGTVLLAGTVAKAGMSVDNKEIETKKSAVVKTDVKFASELGVDIESLNSLGSRIDAARAASDPIALALTAKELAAAEQVSGKTAAVKSADLAKEASVLAMHRHRSSELKAVALLVDAENAKALTADAEKAAKVEAAAKAAKESGEKSKGIMGTLHVDNRTGDYVRVFIDGVYIGTISPFGDLYRYIGQGAWETTFVDAVSSGGAVWSGGVDRPAGDYTLTLR